MTVQLTASDLILPELPKSPPLLSPSESVLRVMGFEKCQPWLRPGVAALQFETSAAPGVGSGTRTGAVAPRAACPLRPSFRGASRQSHRLFALGPSRHPLITLQLSENCLLNPRKVFLVCFLLFPPQQKMLSNPSVGTWRSPGMCPATRELPNTPGWLVPGPM